jgi:hypothetical protein
MQKRKLLIIFVSITTLCLISISAQCSIEREAPSVELEIYDGPDYSESDNMCYYRIEAIVSGTPDPEIEFDTDDNVSPLGSSRVEVGVEAGNSYTLTVTATNIAGTSTASIILSGECGEQVAEVEVAEEEEEAEVSEKEAEEEAEAEAPDEVVAEDKDETEYEDLEVITIEDVILPPTTEPAEFYGDYNKSGTIREDGNISYGRLFIGDDLDDHVYKGYLSFDISSISALEDVTITYAKVEIPGVRHISTPWMAGEKLYIKVYHYGDTLVYPEDFREGGEHVKTFDLLDLYLLNPSEDLDDLSFSNDKLKDELQKAVDAGQSDFQFKLGLGGQDNGDGLYWFWSSNCKLIVEYEVPAS